MQYRHAPAANHAALDAVLVSAAGRPTLPVRLTLELFGRALARLRPGRRPVTVWDPCCGAGATLTTLGLLAPGIDVLVGTDADPAPLDLARRNLHLLDDGGLAARATELDELAARHGKQSYAEAAGAARTLVPPGRPMWTVGAADALDPRATRAVVGDRTPDVVIADLPHGRQTGWTGGDRAPVSAGPPPEIAFLREVSTVSGPDAVVVAVGRGRSVPLPGGTRALEKIRVGHRAAVLVRAGELGGA